MATFLWASVAVRAPDGWVNLGVLVKKGADLRWQVRPGVRPQTATDLEVLVARAVQEETVDSLWEYLLDRGLGGLSSVSVPQTVSAKTWPAAVAKVQSLSLE